MEMGFSLVIATLIESKKPLIGHNPMYDWLFVYNQFIAPLPATYVDFISQWSKMFPYTYDNKVLTMKVNDQKALQLNYQFDKKNILKFAFDRGFERYTKKIYEAGY